MAHTCQDQRPTCESWDPLSPLWAPGIKLRFRLGCKSFHPLNHLSSLASHYLTEAALHYYNWYFDKYMSRNNSSICIGWIKAARVPDSMIISKFNESSILFRKMGLIKRSGVEDTGRVQDHSLGSLALMVQVSPLATLQSKERMKSQ